MAGHDMAAGVEGVIAKGPPGWLEAALLRCLPERDRETVSGDLLEEYREVQLPRLGAFGANIWYARQVLSFLTTRTLGGSAMRASLTWMCVATALAGVWLAVMENVLRHPGYAARSIIALLIMLQGLVTILFLMVHGRSVYRVIVAAGAVGAIALGASALLRILSAAHFEGFVLLIGAALVIQGSLALLVVGGPRWAPGS